MHNGIQWVTTVTAGSTDRWFSGTLILENGLNIIGWTTFSGYVSVKDVSLVYDETISECKYSELLSKWRHKIIKCKEWSIVDKISSISSSTNIQAVILTSDDFDLKNTPCFCIMVVTSKDAVDLIQYVKSRDKPVVTVKFPKNYYKHKSYTKRTYICFKRSFTKLFKYLEARCNGTWCVYSCWLDSKPTCGSLGSFSAL